MDVAEIKKFTVVVPGYAVILMVEDITSASSEPTRKQWKVWREFHPEEFEVGKTIEGTLKQWLDNRGEKYAYNIETDK